MADDEGVRGADALLALSRRLKSVDVDLRKEMVKALSASARPLIPKVRDAARANLPKKGKLNERFAKKPYRAQTRTGEKTAGVRITGNKLDPRVDREGRVYHPVFGRKGAAANGGVNAVVQPVPGAKGYFSDTLSNSQGEVRDQIVSVLEDFARRLVNGSGPGGG